MGISGAEKPSKSYNFTSKEMHLDAFSTVTSLSCYPGHGVMGLNVFVQSACTAAQSYCQVIKTHHVVMIKPMSLIS
jgi:hypothetical protein